MSVSWRALLADGRVISYDGDNTPQPVLDLIVRFEVLHGERVIVALEPQPYQRVVFRWDRAVRGGQQLQLGVKVGLVDRETGTALVCELTDGPMRVTSNVVLTPEEVA